MRAGLLAFIGLAAAQRDLISVLQSQSDLSTLLSAIQLVPGLASTLNSSSDITILAPTNAAFNRLDPESQEGIAVAQGLVNATQTLLAYHVINGTYESSDIPETPLYVKTLLNSSYAITDTVRSNVTGGQNVGLIDYGNDTYAAISSELLTSTITEADISVNGGDIIIHKIDTVLFIPLNASQTASDFGLNAAGGALNSVGLISNGEDDGTLDIVTDLTLFIPSNEAFEAIGNLLVNASRQTLISVLEYHAITGSVLFSTDLSNTTAETVEGSDVTISLIDDTIFVNDARVIIPNILLSNGVAHVIDSVLNPDESSPTRSDLDPSASATVAFPSATTVTDLPFTSTIISAVTTLSVPTWATTAPALDPSQTRGGSSNDETSSGAAMPVATAVNAVLYGGAMLAAGNWLL